MHLELPAALLSEGGEAVGEGAVGRVPLLHPRAVCAHNQSFRFSRRTLRCDRAPVFQKNDGYGLMNMMNVMNDECDVGLRGSLCVPPGVEQHVLVRNLLGQRVLVHRAQRILTTP